MQKSSFISDDEHNRFASLYSYECKILGVAVARLYISLNNEWKYTDTGLAALVKDNKRRNYYIQIINMDHFKLSCEFEIIWSCKYEKFQDQIHTFNGVKDVILLSFADYNESDKFESEIKDIIKIRNNQRQRKRENAMNNQANGNIVIPNNNPPNFEIKAPVSRSDTKSNKNTKGRPRITKNDISNPSNFQHVDHMGINEHFFKNPNDERLLELLKVLKLDKLLDDDKSKKDIYDIVESHGGILKFENEMKQNESKGRKAPSIPKPPINGSQKAPPVPPPFRPPPNQYVPPMQVGQKPSMPHGVAPQPPPLVSVPPPPVGSVPPPPPQGVIPPPPPVLAPPSLAQPPVNKPSQNKPPLGDGAPRGGLLGEITSFDPTKLKSSSQNTRPKNDDVDLPGPGSGSILESLAFYLQGRQTKMAADNSDSEEESESGEEWND